MLDDWITYLSEQQLVNSNFSAYKVVALVSISTSKCKRHIYFFTFGSSGGSLQLAASFLFALALYNRLEV